MDKLALPDVPPCAALHPPPTVSPTSPEIHRAGGQESVHFGPGLVANKGIVPASGFSNCTTCKSRFKPPSRQSHTACCCQMSPTIPPMVLDDCEECAQSCGDVGCTIELTPHCTDQCVVVCSDAHHVVPPPSEVACPAGFDCDGLEEFFQCCAEYHSPPTLDGKSYQPDWNSSTVSWEQSFEQFLANNSASSFVQGNSVPSSYNDPAMAYHQSHAQSHTGGYNQSTYLPTPGLPDMPMSSNSGQQLDPRLDTSPSTATTPPQAGLKCMWGSCNAAFSSMAELVGHVNLQHLRLPAAQPSTGNNPVDMQQRKQEFPNSIDNVSCLWGDCHLYPTPDTIPGPSTGDPVNSALGVLAHHLLQDHLGLSNVTVPSVPSSNVDAALSPNNWDSQAKPPPLNTQASSSCSSTVSLSGPPTPAPEHDCSAPTHVCRWTGCGKTFVSCDELTAHITATHVGGGKAHYDCFWEGCDRHGDRGFASKQKICRHLQSHTGHRPFQCKLCKQNFSEAATLQQHMRRHTQEKPYVCDFPGCGKSFAITGALTIHKRIHNGHKPFKCAYCDRAFSESSNLSKHLRTHTGARPYACTHPDCNKAFARPDQLARHMTVHRKKAGTLSGSASTSGGASPQSQSQPAGIEASAAS
ncbi:hypothetical protein K474DRAFT_1666821 [Panus rudis PR-1116 ss-1]|nr:hypothetical protein K474DRAFT_1666821 [Panus rudis PR-1116 ss-1]